MNHKRRICELIDIAKESDIVDFKEEYYHQTKKHDLIKDIISFANNLSMEDKYIIFGVSDNERKVVGIDKATIPDISDINQLIKTYCEPFISIELEELEVDHKNIAAIIIKHTNNQQPYIVTKDLQVNNKVTLREGDIYIRKSANNFRASRNDLEQIYKQRHQVEILSVGQQIAFRLIEINKVKKQYCCIPINFINNTENSFVFDSIKIKWIYSESTAGSEVEFVEEEKDRFKEIPIHISRRPYYLSAKSQDRKTLYIHISEKFCDIIKQKYQTRQNLKIQISMYDAQKIEFKTSFDVETIKWN